MDEGEEVIAAMQREEETIRTEFAAVPEDGVFERGQFDPENVDDLPGWKRALAGAGHGHGHDDHHHPDEVYGVTSFTYRTRRPFHPERVAEVLRTLPAGVVRSKGTLWVAGSDLRIVLGQAGP